MQPDAGVSMRGIARIRTPQKFGQEVCHRVNKDPRLLPETNGILFEIIFYIVNKGEYTGRPKVKSLSNY